MRPLLDVNRPMKRRTAFLLPLLGTVLFAACASSEVDQRIAALERRIDKLGQRVGSLEQAQSTAPRPVQAPCVDPEQLRAQIKTLWARRDALSLNYTDAHPGIRNIDKQIERLEQRLRDTESAAVACEDTRPADRD